MSYIDLRDFGSEYSVTVTDYMDTDSYRFEIEKLGGGTYGERYVGTWRYIVFKNDVEVARGQDFKGSMPMSHREAAIDIAEFVADSVTEHEFHFPVEEKYLNYDGEWVACD